MKKFLIYLLSFILICFVVPAMLSSPTASTVAQENTGVEVQKNQRYCRMSVLGKNRIFRQGDKQRRKNGGHKLRGNVRRGKSR